MASRLYLHGSLLAPYIGGGQRKLHTCAERYRMKSWIFHTDKEENQIFLIYKEIPNGAVAKSYMTNGLLIVKYLHVSSYIRKPFLIDDFATAPLRILLHI
jgi:hypothetical protein